MGDASGNMRRVGEYAEVDDRGILEHFTCASFFEEPLESRLKPLCRRCHLKSAYYHYDIDEDPKAASVEFDFLHQQRLVSPFPSALLA